MPQSSPKINKIFGLVGAAAVAAVMNRGEKSSEPTASESADAVKLARRFGRLSCLTVIPGYDDTKIRKPGLKADRADGQTYGVLWEEAMKANPDWVLMLGAQASVPAAARAPRASSWWMWP